MVILLLAMYTVSELERLTKLTRKQIYDRLRLLSQLLDGEVTIGRNGKKLLTENGFALFNRFRVLEAEGLTGQAAVNLMSQELGKPVANSNNVEVTRSSGGSKPEVTPSEVGTFQSLDLLLEEKDKRLRDKDDEIRYLRERLAYLEGQLALPAPQPRRSIFARIFRLGRRPID